MSDHIPDVTKMIGETPRTESFNCYDSGCDDPLHAWGAFSAELERELNAANRKIELLMSANADVARIADERDAAENRIRLLIAERDTARRQADQNYKLRKEFADLLGTDDVEQGVAVVRELKQRIKRLEEDLNELRSDEARLLNSNGELERRIKLLEEAGDLMVQHFYTDEPRSEMWEKAKEDKP
jgi:hypothetical protein